MKTTVSFKDFHEAYWNLRPDSFSEEALVQLFNYLQELDRQMETDTLLDITDICCQYSERSLCDIPIEDWDEDWEEGLDDDDLDHDLIDEHRKVQVEKVRDYLKKKTTIVGFTDDSVIYAEY